MTILSSVICRSMRNEAQRFRRARGWTARFLRRVPYWIRRKVEVPTGLEPVYKVLQTAAYPLGQGAKSPARSVARRVKCPGFCS